MAVGRLFAGESMFHRATDASKVALAALVDVLEEDGEPWLLDVQWQTTHLKTLGVRTVDRPTYLRLARGAVAAELPSRWRGTPGTVATHVRGSGRGDGMVSPRHTR